MPFLTHAGATLRYDRAGRGPAVLLVHGLTANRTFWERQVQALRDRFTVVTVDLRGHGESSRPARGYGIGQLAADLEQLVRTLGASRVAVVGWSMGGMVAQELVHRLGPRASALALVCTTAGGVTDPKAAGADPAAAESMRRALAEDFRAFVRTLATDLFKAGDQHPLFPWALAQMQKTSPAVAEACFDALLAFDGRKRLADLKVPTAVLHGRGDRLLSLAQGEFVARQIEGAELVVFEDSAHAPHLEEPDRFNEALLRLLERATQ
jgi:pimeloyl-ACP methyl ester carboxylesterase